MSTVLLTGPEQFYFYTFLFLYLDQSRAPEFPLICGGQGPSGRREALGIWYRLAFMFCPHCTQSMRVPTKFECFLCLESIRNQFMPLGKDLLAAKLNYLQRGGGCCKKK